MATGDKRLKEVVEYYTTNGTAQTLEAFSIPEETLNRYKRGYKQKFGEYNDLLGKMRDKYSDSELESFLSLDTRAKPYSIRKLEIEGEHVKFLALGDDHIGSLYFEESVLLSAFKEAEKQGCSFMVNTGDLIEGMSGRAGHVYELRNIGYSEQRKEAIRLYSQWKKPCYVIEGNHPAWINTKQDAGLNIIEDIAEKVPDMHYLGGHEGRLEINGVSIMLVHGNDASGSYAFSYRLQKIAEMFTGGEKPQICFVGHSHKSIFIQDRNILMVSTGSIQYQSGFMRSKRIPAHTGFWIIDMVTHNNEVKSFTPTWYPVFK
jgi:predicted phosphodiesterase